MNRRRLTLIAGIVVVALILFTIGTTVALQLRPQPLDPLTEVSYRQAKAVPGWDDSTRTTTDTVQLTQLYDVLTSNGWRPGQHAEVDTASGCVGGTTTELDLHFADDSTVKAAFYSCGGDTDRLTNDVTRLIASWRSENA
jgi:hypothetical protein